MEIGQVCVKLAGRDAGQECVIVDVLDGVFVLVDGNTRRRKCNIRHLEPLEKFVEIRKGASHEDVLKAMKEVGLKVIEFKKGERSIKSKRPVIKRRALLKNSEAKTEEKKKLIKESKKVEKK